eukprot:241719-Pleurochrysis_carterae.AAC.1
MPVNFVDCGDDHPGSLGTGEAADVEGIEAASAASLAMMVIKAAIDAVKTIAAASTDVRERLRRLERSWRCGDELVSGPGVEGTVACRLEVSWATNDVATGRTAREAAL